MSKYIKLEDAIEQVKTEFYGGGYQEWLEISIDNLINRIANLPTIEIVRCKDCKWYKDFDGCFFSTAECEPEHFCSYGERKSIDDLIEQVDNLIAFEKELIGGCNICRFAGCSECDDCINGSQWVRMTKDDEVEE